MSRAEEILNFWFGHPKDKNSYGIEKPFWWSSTKQLDDEIREKFLPNYEKAVGGDYEHWKTDPYSSLALVLLFDQIPRNIFRGTAQTYATDHLAQKTSKFAIQKGFDQELKLKVERKFLYMPFAHSESLEDQKTCLILFKPLNNEGWYNYSESYFKIIQKFGRFPHRNKILGRVSTAQEVLEYGH